MKIINLEHVQGTNDWSSVYDNLVIIDLQVQGEEMPGETKKSLWLNELESRFPSLIDYESGGLKKSPVSDGHGAFVALMVELVSCELQLLAGINSMFGEVCELPGESSVYRIIISCDRKETGIYAAKAAVDIVQDLVKDKPLEFSKHLDRLMMLRHGQEMLETAA